jgi:hypothetical protein
MRFDQSDSSGRFNSTMTIARCLPMHTFVTLRIDGPDPSHGTRRRPRDYTSCDATKDETKGNVTGVGISW